MIKFNHVHLKATDHQSSAEWYCRWLGATIKDDAFSMADGSMAIVLDLGGCRVFVSGPPPAESLTHQGSQQHFGLEHIALTVPDVGSLVNAMAEAGVHILAQPHRNRYGSLIAFIQGPDDVRVELVTYPEARK